MLCSWYCWLFLVNLWGYSSRIKSHCWEEKFQYFPSCLANSNLLIGIEHWSKENKRLGRKVTDTLTTTVCYYIGSHDTIISLIYGYHSIVTCRIALKGHHLWYLESHYGIRDWLRYVVPKLMGHSQESRRIIRSQFDLWLNIHSHVGLTANANAPDQRPHKCGIPMIPWHSHEPI